MSRSEMWGDEMMERVERLEAENRRLRAALQAIVDCKPKPCVEEPRSSAAWFMYSGNLLKIAQEALKGSPSGSEGSNG